MSIGILITGATGYLGSHITRSLVDKGYQILCLCRCESSFARIKDLEQYINIVYTPLTDKKIKAIRLFNPGIVIHAATVYESEGSLQEILDANLYMPLTLLELTTLTERPRWIITGTALPTQLNKYALSKHQFSQWGNYFSTQKGITFINLSLESFYGPKSPENYFISNIIKKLRNNEPIDLTIGTQHRDFVYIDDVVNVVNDSISLPITGFIDIPIGTGQSPSIREIVLFLKATLKSNSELRWGAIPARKDEPDKFCDLSKMISLGLSCPTLWMDGMTKILGVEQI